MISQNSYIGECFVALEVRSGGMIKSFALLFSRISRFLTIKINTFSFFGKKNDQM